ncbi:hypothetical protein PC118_g5067 [Phytophthora cactorum]|nr:hypothetical protein PC111_g4586 [Phytophthora cactorum]KAG2840713.1 hypothetical protein PC112_g3644 [Phytophthora cactorum]KAG2863106.1 hypothetical protein PC113_g5735 [Phytophthora cactorum]KAG2948844.1 hypothetical protein PC117_g5719 [Phytophthora cactorum]KAG2991482.1 hypothetical protein PC118_g5067 [Phytophthora cactorum]
MTLFDETGNSAQRFVASDNWVTRFMARYDLSMRRRTNLTTLTDDVLTDRAVSYMAFLEEHKPDMDPARVIMMDETAVFFEDPCLYTVNEHGAHHVVMRSTGFASMRVTAMLSVTLSGKKLSPVIIWKGTTTTTFERVGGCLVIQQPKAWAVFGVGFDASAHREACEGRVCEEEDQDVCGLMPYLQASDVGIYRSFKDRMVGLITAWKESDAVTYTRGVNPRPPFVETVADWVSTAWKRVPEEVVMSSIYGCGFDDDFKE